MKFYYFKCKRAARKEISDIDSNIKFDDFDEIKKHISKHIRDFEISELLYSKGNNIIYKSSLKQKKDLRYYVIKCLKKVNKKKRRKRDIHLSEAMIQQKLKHNNILYLRGFYDLASCSALIFDYHKYGDLNKFQTTFLKRRFLSETFLCYLSSQILEALKYIHQNKIIHLDIKQKNILVNDTLQFKLSDFSISLDYKNNKDYIKLPIAGTFGHMSPEVLNGAKIKVLEASKIDIFSFGVLLYYSAFGKYPYDLENVDDKDYDKMSEQIEATNLEFPEDIKVSDLFKSFLKKCLEKNITDRYDIFNIFNDKWIKGGEIIKDYKENLCNTNIFLIDLITDNIIDYNIYIKNKFFSY